MLSFEDVDKLSIPTVDRKFREEFKNNPSLKAAFETAVLRHKHDMEDRTALLKPVPPPPVDAENEAVLMRIAFAALEFAGPPPELMDDTAFHALPDFFPQNWDLDRDIVILNILRDWKKQPDQSFETTARQTFARLSPLPN